MNQLQILVTGANGFIGHTLCSEALARGMKVRVVTRTHFNLSSQIESITKVEINDQTNWQDALTNCDIIVHLAARVHVMNDQSENPLQAFLNVNLHGTINLARQAAVAGVKRFVYVSSIKVNGEYTDGKGFTEEDEPKPQDPYAISKWQAEQALLQLAKDTGMEVVIIRPPLVYGADVKGNFMQMIRVIASGMPLPLASVQNQRDLVYVNNLVDALIACATHPNAAGQTYLVSDGEDVSTLDLIRNLSKALGKRCFIFSFPVLIMKFLANLLGKSTAIDRLTQSLRVDGSKIRNELGWTPPYTTQQGLQATADWYLQSKKI